jgi:hypothetical protein
MSNQFFILMFSFSSPCHFGQTIWLKGFHLIFHMFFGCYFVDRTMQNGRKRTGSLNFCRDSSSLAGRSDAVQGNQADKLTLAARVLGAGALFCQGRKTKQNKIFISTSKLARKWYPGGANYKREVRFAEASPRGTSFHALVWFSSEAGTGIGRPRCHHSHSSSLCTCLRSQLPFCRSSPFAIFVHLLHKLIDLPKLVGPPWVVKKLAKVEPIIFWWIALQKWRRRVRAAIRQVLRNVVGQYLSMIRWGQNSHLVPVYGVVLEEVLYFVSHFRRR